MLSQAEKAGVGNYAEDFEAALVGLQMRNLDMPTMTPTQYAVALAAGLYAAQCLVERGDALPKPSSEANFRDFLVGAAANYASTLAQTAVAQATEVLEMHGINPKIAEPE